MNTIKKVTEFPTPTPIRMGQIYQYGDDFYIVAKRGDNFTGCLINMHNGNLWSTEPVEKTIANNSDFILFRGTIQIITDY